MSMVCAVMVTYNTSAVLIENISILMTQVAHVIIVDNASGPITQNCISECITAFPEKMTVVKNIDNVGLSMAQNIGIRLALDRGADWVLLLDDDSTPVYDMVKSLLDYFSLLPQIQQEDIRILYPNVIDKNTLKKVVFLTQDYYGIKISTCPDQGVLSPIIAMSSGSLIKAETFGEVGLMDENFFIDQIDVDFSLRVINLGLKIVVVGNAILFHSLGMRSSVNILGRTITPTNHNAFRCYHIYRNRVIVWRRYLKQNTAFVLFDSLVAIYHLLKIVFMEKNKFRKIWNITSGVFDGLLFGIKELDY